MSFTTKQKRNWLSRDSLGCKSILISTDRNANTMKMVQFGTMKRLGAYFNGWNEASGFERLLVAPPKSSISTENFGYEH